MTYQGQCHCGAVRFVVQAEIDHVRVCDCSICSMRGALNFRIPDKALSLSTPWDALHVYRWGTRTGADYFCSTCGIMPFRRPSAPSPQEVRNGVIPFDGWAVNVRCLSHLDIEALPAVQINGREI